MKPFNPGYLFISLTIVLTVVGQLLVKYGIIRAMQSLGRGSSSSSIILAAFLRLEVLAGLLCAVLAAVSWFPAISRLPISVAYPFMALPIVLVLLLAPMCFAEHVTVYRWIGVALVSLGLWVASR